MKFTEAEYQEMIAAYVERKRKHINHYMVPGATVHAFDDYILHRNTPGGFIQAVLSNDLKGAVQSADTANRSNLSDIVNYMIAVLPAVAQGSKEAMYSWIDSKKNNVATTETPTNAGDSNSDSEG